MKHCEYVNILFFFAVALCSVYPSFAQEKGGMFSDDFVLQKKSATQKKTTQDSATIPTEKQQQLAVKNVLDQESGIKAYSLGLIVNALDQEHYIRNLQAAIDTAAHNDLTITQIIAVGLIPEGREAQNAGFTFRGAELFALKVLDGKLTPVNKIPERFQVKQSPSWIINTEKGSIIIEGKEEIWEFFNAKGEFREKGIAPKINKLHEPTS